MMNPDANSYVTTRPTNQVTREGKGIRKKVDIIDLVKMNSGGAVPDFSVERDVFIATASSKVNVTIEIFFDADREVPAAGGPDFNSLWRLVAYAKGVNRAVTRLHLVHPIPPTAFSELPEAYEYSTGVEFALAQTFLGRPVAFGVTDVPGTWYLRATWENTQEMPDDELDIVFNKCFLRAANYTQVNNFVP